MFNISSLPKKGWVYEVGIPCAYLVAVLLIDRMLPMSPVTSVFLTVGLLVMAFFLEARVIAFWGMVYLGVVGAIFLNRHFYFLLSGGKFPAESLTLYFRLVQFAFVGAFCVTLAFVLRRQRVMTKNLQEILLRMPIPVLIADGTGRIFFSNDAVGVLLGSRQEEAKAYRNVFDVFSSKEGLASMIRQYGDVFQNSSKNRSLELEIRGKQLFAHCQPLDYGSPRMLLMMITESPSLNL